MQTAIARLLAQKERTAEYFAHNEDWCREHMEQEKQLGTLELSITAMKSSQLEDDCLMLGEVELEELLREQALLRQRCEKLAREV